MVDKMILHGTRFANRLGRELGEVAQSLDGTGWAVLSGVLLVCGWFFLKGNKIKST